MGNETDDDPGTICAEWPFAGHQQVEISRLSPPRQDSEVSDVRPQQCGSMGHPGRIQDAESHARPLSGLETDGAAGDADKR